MRPVTKCNGSPVAKPITPQTAKPPRRIPITGLTAGTQYTVRVMATRIGLADGPASREQTAVPLGNRDYDPNNNNLIDLTTLAQRPDMGCQTTCSGYELRNDLNFDENGNGDRDDTYNQGAGWNPIGTFTATFQGNGYIIENLFINRGSTDNVGLFGISSGRLTQLGLVDVEITGNVNTGGLVGENRGTITASYVTGRVRGEIVGGLVGQNRQGNIAASYATGQVSGNARVGGLLGSRLFGIITASYYDRETSGRSDTGKGEPQTMAALQNPTGYTGIYVSWNIDLTGDSNSDNPWAFGSSAHYPVLRYGRTQAQINAQFFLQIPAGDLRRLADVNQDQRIDEQDALLMYQVYLPALQGVAGVVEADERARALAWQESGRAVGGDINGDGRINEQDALIMVFAYQFRALLQNSADLRKLYFNGLRGEPHGQFQSMPDTDATYREFLRRALRLR